MFAANSRYANASTYQVTLSDGITVTAVCPVSPRTAPIIGFHQRVGGDRLDLVATQYLNAPTGFWRLCDANNSMVGGALQARLYIGIPSSGSQ